MESPTGRQATLDRQGTRQREVFVRQTAYHGWPDCYFIDNGLVEAVVVPAIGRVMQLRLADDEDGVFWENRALDGQLHPPDPSEWINFGGDKCWPAPQTDWARQQGRDWPPPVGFDSSAAKASPEERGVRLTSPVDPAFGIQVVRHVELDAELPVMRIRTEYRKILGSPVTVSIWTITQMQEPERIFLPVRDDSKLPGGLIRLIDVEPESLRIEDGLLSLRRHPRQHTKIGTDAASMVWVGPNSLVRIDSEAGSEGDSGEFPDGGCVTEVYTNPDRLAYVELETLGLLVKMSAGERTERTGVYTILARTAADPDAEARRILFA